VGMGELGHRHGPLAGQLFDIVVRAGHMALLIVRHRATQMLNDVGRNPLVSIEAQYSSIGGSWKVILRPSAWVSSAAICSWFISTGPESGMVAPRCCSGLFKSAAMARP